MSTSEANIINLNPAGKIEKPGVNRRITMIALMLFALGFVFLGSTVSYKQASLYLIAGVLGLALYHAHYGFTSSFRIFLVSGRGLGIRAQMILFFIANLLFLPLLLGVTDNPVAGYVSPVGMSVLIGAFIFGIGMQMGDGCASGTLYHIGGGDSRGILTLIGFVAGSVIGSAHFTWWMATPNIGPVSFIETFGALGGFLLNLALLAFVFMATIYIERRRNGNVESLRLDWKSGWKTVYRGPWPLIIGSVVLAVGNAVVLYISGKPWGVTSAFALWGAKISQALGIQVTDWGYWQTPANAAALNSSIFKDVTSVINIGLMLGALLALGLSGKPNRFLRNIPPRMIAGLLIGGIMMGYGARIAFGCNIGAYFGGIASFSLHGWEWMIGAMLGSVIGVKLRPVCAFGKNE
ncbi:YeeE/YedE family protein [Paenibacillus naphthalenovorans]|uniref:YeeE/YedE family protein n=1 Tax=Paenibacillus naphthalenovorans TaxID=162209 RepID=UPI003D2DB755